MTNYLKYIALVILLGTNKINAQLFINEVIPANKTVLADNFGEFDDIIEIYNAGNSSIDLANYYISDNFSNPTKWQIPSTNSSLTTIPAGGYIIFWADGETSQGELHVDFNLSSSGDQMMLTAPDAITLIDSFSFPGIPNDLGYGRLPDASTTLSPLIPASPQATNNNSAPKAGKPVISPPSGKYTGTQTITITGEPGCTFYYTVDGSLPTTSSTPYSTPFTIDTTQSIRAIAVKSGFENSFVTTSVYFIDFTSTLPIYHISMDPIDLWSDTAGIYVTGTNGVTGYCDYVTARNWNMSWEKEAHLKIFMDDTLVVENNIGIKIGGNCKRRKPQKPLNIILRNEYSDYGDNEINYPLFADNELEHFKRLYVRDGNNHIQELFTDLAVARMVTDKFDIDGQSGQPSIIFLNGQYMGIQNIREKYDKWHYENDFPKTTDDRDSVDILKNPGRDYPSTTWWAWQRATYGDTMSWYNFIYDVDTRDVSNNADYEAIMAQVDDNELLNYLMTGHFCSAKDWISNNQKVWKEKGAGKKWRWTMVDYDNSMKAANLTYNNLSGKILRNNIHGRNYYSNILFRKLFQHPEFRGEYIQRMITYMETIFTNGVLDPIVDDYYNEILPDLPQANALYGHTLAAYQSQVQEMKDFVTQRPPYVRTHMENQWGLSGDFQLDINFDASSNGTVRLHSNYFEIPYNHSATYYDSIPIVINAIPNTGYRFSHWQETGDTNASLYEFYTANTTLTPIFVPALDLVINEIHYHPSDSINEKEFIEIYNPDTAPRDLTRYEISSGFCFEFPEGTIIQPGEYIVIAADASQFAGNGYQVFQWNDSKLSNNGENVILQNPAKQTIDSVDYSDNLPWPLLADGFGKSLELDYPIPANNESGDNWHASNAIDGSPGAQNSIPCQNTPPAIVINEINYNSHDQTNPGDWIELHNTSSNPVNISNWKFYDSENSFDIPSGTTLAAGDFIILAQDVNLFTSIFPHLQGGNLLGDFTFALSSGGERVAITDQNDCIVDELRYDDNLPWDSIPDGNGSTLSLIDPNSDNLLPGAWEASSNINAPFGTPGRANIPCPTFSITAPANICKNDTILLHTTTNNNANFTWVIQGGTPATATGDSIYVVFQNPGLALVELQYTYFECSDSDQQLLTIDPCNQPPIPESDNYTINEDNTLQGNILTNDNDPEGQPLTVSLINDVGNGILTLNANGSFTFQPDPDYFGSDNFIYEVCDNGSPVLCATQLVNIIINSVNDAPMANTDSYTENEDTGITGNVLTNDSDIEGNALITSINILPVNGTVSLQANGDFTYTPNTNFFGSDSLIYEVCDNGMPALCVTETVHFSIAPVNDPPIAISDNYTINEDNSLSDNVLTNDQEIENQPMTSQLLVNCLKGTVSFNPDGSFNYTPNPDFFGVDSLIYEVCDDSTPALCSQETAIINVLPINDQPIVLNDTLATNEGIQVAGNANTNDFDVETNPMNYNLLSFTQNGSVLFNFDGSFYYTPFAGFSGVDSFQYRACDNGTPVYCDTATVYIEVIPDCVILDIDLVLEGAYNPQTGYMNTTLNTVRAILPGMTGNPTAGQPYNSSPWNYQGTEGAGWADADYTNTVVDWVLISFRTDITKASEVYRLAGLLHTDGSMTFPGECPTTSDLSGDYYLVVEHRNHMAVMSPTKLSVVNRELSWDFRLANSYESGGNGAKQLPSGIWSLYAGDCNQIDDAVSYDINGKDKASWLVDNGKFGVYLTSDINMNGDVNGADKALWLLNNGVFGSVKK